MGAIFAGPPKVPKPPPPPPPPPRLPDGGVQQAGADQRARALAAAGAGSTIATSPQGILVPPSLSTKTKTGE